MNNVAIKKDVVVILSIIAALFLRVAYDLLFQRPYSPFFSGIKIPSPFPENYDSATMWVLWLFYQMVFLVLLYYFSFRIFSLIFKIKKSEQKTFNTPQHNYSKVSEALLVVLMAIPLFVVLLFSFSYLFPEEGFFDLIFIVPLGIPISLLLSWGIIKLVFKIKK